MNDMKTRMTRRKDFSLIFCIFSMIASIIEVNAQKGWHAVSPPNVTALLGVSAGTVPDEVYGAVNDNTKGPNVWHSVDMSNTGKFIKGGKLNMDIALSGDGTTLCLVGPGSITYGPSGNDFTNTPVTQFSRIVTQSVEPILDTGFGVVGRFIENSTFINGVVVSFDKGQTWRASDIGLNATTYPARYAAFPSATTWFVTTGTWPNGTDDRLANGKTVRLTGRLSLIYRGIIDGQPWIQFISHRKNLNSYPGAIMKTDDGGLTWKKVYDSNNRFYFNKISCYDINTCYTVGEGGKSALILATYDGGETWEKKLNLNGPFSIHAVQMKSKTEIFAAGGTLSPGPIRQKEIVGNYYHSCSNGSSWKLQSFNGYGYDVSFRGEIGYAATLFKRFCSIITYF